jgi:hypothetical protein
MRRPTRKRNSHRKLGYKLTEEEVEAWYAQINTIRERQCAEARMRFLQNPRLKKAGLYHDFVRLPPLPEERSIYGVYPMEMA